jgi:hypothetical protein
MKRWRKEGKQEVFLRWCAGTIALNRGIEDRKLTPQPLGRKGGLIHPGQGRESRNSQRKGTDGQGTQVRGDWRPIKQLLCRDDDVE